MGIMQKLWAKPATNRTISPSSGSLIHENTRLRVNHATAPASMVRAGRMRAPWIEMAIEPTSAPAAKQAISQPRPVWSRP